MGLQWAAPGQEDGIGKERAVGYGVPMVWGKGCSTVQFPNSNADLSLLWAPVIPEQS